MIVELNRTNCWGKSPDVLAFKENRLYTSYCSCKTLDDVRSHPHASKWFFREGTQNHREVGDKTAVDSLQDVWLCEIPSLEWAVAKWGRLVIQSSDVVGIELNVEIYDDYRE